jgi:RNA polymerase sigma factor (TIGR02999 family)
MSPAFTEQVTYWLQQWRLGDPGALEKITDAVYRDLRRIAGHYLSGERPDHTLEATALVHEMYLQAASIREIDWKARGQFLSMAAQTMRRILIDHARRRRASKRQHTPEGDCFSRQCMGFDFDVLAIHEALEKMETSYPRHVRIVELRFFGGLESPEIATALEISLSTVERSWRFAKAWLQNELSAR